MTQQHFVHAFGPDLVGLPVKSVEFYRRMCGYVGIATDHGIVIDDNGAPLAMAAEAGCRTVFVEQGHSTQTLTTQPNAHVGAITDLPAVVEALV